MGADFTTKTTKDTKGLPLPLGGWGSRHVFVSFVRFVVQNPRISTLVIPTLRPG